MRVELVRCVDDEPGQAVAAAAAAASEDERDDEADCATFEFLRLEAAYDMVFATTNSHCPLRTRAEGGEGSGVGEADERGR